MYVQSSLRKQVSTWVKNINQGKIDLVLEEIEAFINHHPWGSGTNSDVWDYFVTTKICLCEAISSS